MRRATLLNWQMIFVTPFVVGIVTFGLWVAVAGAYEKVRLAHALDQIFSAVKIARAMGVDVNVDPEWATTTLLNKLSRLETMRTTESSTMGQQGLLNPWGGFVGVSMLPEAQALRLENMVAPHVCRRLIQFYNKEAISLRVRRMETRDNVPLARWRMLYDAPPGSVPVPIDSLAIKVGCGEAPQVIVALTFRLR